MSMLSLRDLLPRGLRRNTSDSATEGLLLCTHWKPNARGLVSPIAITNTYTAGAGPIDNNAFPFPQLLAGPGVYYALGKTTSGGGFHLVTTNSSFVYAATLDTTSTLPTTNGAGTMRTLTMSNNFVITQREGIFFICSPTAMLTNANVYGDLGGAYTTSGGWALAVPATETYPLSVAIDIQGRLIFGGMSVLTADFASGDRYDIWDVLRKHNSSSLVTEDSLPNNRMLFWGMPNGAEADIPYTAELSLFCGVKVATYKHILMGLARRNEFGFTYIPWEGKINEVHRLGDELVVYGDYGIGIASWDGQGYVIRRSLDVGTTATGDVCANVNQHIFLDRNGMLWSVKAGKGFELLDYSEFLSSFAGVCRISYDKLYNDYYITKSDGTTYCLADTKGGKYEHALHLSMYKPWCLVEGNASRYGVFATADTFAPVFKTGKIDMDNRDVKTLDYVEIGKETIDSGTSSLAATVSFRAGGAAYTTPAAVAFNPAGIADVVRTGIDFQVAVSGVATYTNTEPITYCNIAFREQGEKKSVGGYL